MALTSAAEFRHSILIVLSAYPEGSRTRAEVLRDIDEARHDEWTAEDLDSPESDDRKVNWHVQASYERARMVREGLLTDDADGRWTLTDQGWQQADQAIRDSVNSAAGVFGKSLSEVTDPAAVKGALDEFRTYGRGPFLAKYGLQESRDYFVRYDGALYDSKPILSVAHRFEHPEMQGLPTSAFSGGMGGAVRALNRLGYEVVTPAQLEPPAIGDTFTSRTAIYERFGGDKVAGIITLPGDRTVNVFADAYGPDANDLPVIGSPFGYRGEGLNGPQRLSQRGNALFERARENREPIRFWYKPVGENFSFLTWAFIVGRAWVLGNGADGVARREIEWQILSVQAKDEAVSGDVGVDEWDVSPALDDQEVPPEAEPDPSYQDLLSRVDGRGQPRKKSGVVRTDFIRSAAARRAVLVRAAGECESPRCTGMPGEMNRAGKAILDVDHIRDLALGGDDHPLNMAALCPNCHACKTRGANQSRWRKELLEAVRETHRVAAE